MTDARDAVVAAQNVYMVAVNNIHANVREHVRAAKEHANEQLEEARYKRNSTIRSYAEQITDAGMKAAGHAKKAFCALLSVGVLIAYVETGGTFDPCKRHYWRKRYDDQSTGDLGELADHDSRMREYAHMLINIVQEQAEGTLERLASCGQGHNRGECDTRGPRSDSARQWRRHA